MKRLLLLVVLAALVVPAAALSAKKPNPMNGMGHSHVLRAHPNPMNGMNVRPFPHNFRPSHLAT